MADKKAVTVALTSKQRDQIKRATGKSINALKVSPMGGLVAAGRKRLIQVGRVGLAKRPIAVGRVGLAKRPDIF
jgi:hypothetical protein